VSSYEAYVRTLEGRNKRRKRERERERERKKERKKENDCFFLLQA
jgi:hypothetical protein